jgi:hypothetical protein
MQRQLPLIDPAEPAEKALLRFRAGDGQTLLVAKDGQLQGILTTDNVREFLLIRAALNSDGSPRKLQPSPIERNAA